MLTRMTRMARMLTHMLTRMTRWLAGSHITLCYVDDITFIIRNILGVI